jgi:hypothetical protein
MQRVGDGAVHVGDPEFPRGSGVTRLGGCLFWALAVLWVLVGLVVLLGLVFVTSNTDWDAWCKHETGDSDFGDGTWSWLPMGVECRWSQASGNLVDDY